jgi:hypothetical protein
MARTTVSVREQSISIPECHFQALFTALQIAAGHGRSSFRPGQEHTLYDLLWNCWRIEVVFDEVQQHLVRFTLPRGIKLAVLETWLLLISPFVQVPAGNASAGLLVRFTVKGSVYTYLYRFSAGTLDKFKQVETYEKADLALLPERPVS